MTPPLPTTSALFEPTIRTLKTLGGSGTVQEIYDRLCELENFSEEQQSVLHNGGPQTEIDYRLAWARTYLKMYGALETVRRGVWALTETGRNLTTVDPTTINRVVNKISKKKKQNATSKELANNEIEDAIADSEDELEIDDKTESIPSESEVWIEKLLKILQSLPPDRFERLCQRILRESGFIKVEVIGRKGDGGIDGIGVLKISLLSFQVFFQCKRYVGSVGPSEIRDFRGAMVGRTDKGLFLTTGTFTHAAKQEATRDGAPALDLIDGEQLCHLLKDLQLGVETKMIEVVQLNKSWFDHL
ncbi:MAG: restriction endonuclease [Limnospira sp.]